MQGLALQRSKDHHFQRTAKEVALLRLFHTGVPQDYSRKCLE
jgi:hypothetical protein